MSYTEPYGKITLHDSCFRCHNQYTSMLLVGGWVKTCEACSVWPDCAGHKACRQRPTMLIDWRPYCRKHGRRRLRALQSVPSDPKIHKQSDPSRGEGG